MKKTADQVAVISPAQLFEQAEHLLAYRHPSQEDLRRAVSASYYGIFHLICTDAADQFAGKTQRKKSSAYALVYRSLDHAHLRKVCTEIQSSNGAVNAIVPGGDVRNQLVRFAAITVELQAARNQADYDPTKTYTMADARATIQSARNAASLYEEMKRQQHTVHRTAFLMLLMFKRR